MKIIFVSFPYTHKNPVVISLRLEKARKYCIELLNQGHLVFCPAIFGHDLITMSGIEEHDMTFDKWKELCFAYMKPCNEFHILKLNGWEESIGVSSEKLQATTLSIPIIYADENS